MPMMVWRRPLLLCLLLSTACQSPSPGPAAGTQGGAVPPGAAATGAPAGAPSAEDQEKAAKERAAQRKQKQKELRTKQRELASFRAEQEIAGHERTARQLTVDAALVRTAAQLEQARQELATFLADVRPRELEERRIELDRAIHRAEHQKDELGELTAMYEADEFARSTKELVLKRGRRELEMAERQLAVARKETTHFETVVLPQRERELRQKVADAELERRKAELDGEKARLEFALATRKAQERQADLEEDIAELTEALAKEQDKP